MEENVISHADLFGPAFYEAVNDFFDYKYSTQCFSGGRGCIDGDTLILTPTGPVRARDFKGGLVYAYDGEKVVAAHSGPAVQFTQENLYEVTLDNGDTIAVTDEHRFLTPMGWRMLRELVPGSDYVAVGAKPLQDLPKTAAPAPTEKGVTLDGTLDSRRAAPDAILSGEIAVSRIASVRFLKRDYYYDLYVPFYNNYLSANGIINHNSLKSSTVALLLILGLERDAQDAFARKRRGERNWRHYLTHAICYRKVFGTCESSVYAQLVWAIEKLGLTSAYKCSKSPLKITRISTGQMIYFRGLDDPLKSKSIRPPFSWFKYLWFEEVAEFDGVEELRNVSQSILRGGERFQVFYSYNPPETFGCWVNQEMEDLQNQDPTFHIYYSDYRSVPPEWLGPKFLYEAELLKQRNPRAYRHEYLGEITGNGGTVFPNVREIELTDADISHFDHIYWGCDFGSVDPTVLIGFEYEKFNSRIIIFSEVYESNMMLDDMERRFKEAYFGTEFIRADCAARQMILELENRGLNMLPAKKGPDSILHGVKWLQNLVEICIDKHRCPNAWQEFKNYEYEKSELTGKFTSRFPSKPPYGDHAIDSVRYGAEDISGGGGLFS